MFQFTTTNVINSQYEGGYSDEAHLLWTLGKDAKGEEDVLIVKRVGSFKKSQIVEIDTAEPVTPLNMKAIVNLVPDGAKVGDTCRLVLYIGLSQGSNAYQYANDYYHKGKPFTVEYTVSTKTAEDLVKVITKFGLATQGEELLRFEGTGNVLTIKGVNEYQRFRALSVDLLDAEANHGMGAWTTLTSMPEMTKKETADEVTAAGEYFLGREGFATADYILHNLRIPTCANSTAFSVHEDETPIPGSNYVQFTIHMCAERGPLGMNAVGQHVQSTTTHVLYVLESIADDFKKLLSQLQTVAEVKEVSED